MPRADLLALTAEDLTALTNRGTVKRAQKELESDDPSGTITEDASGAVTVNWSDGTVCTFLAGKSIHDAVCSSGLSGISRHIVRSVFAYQRQYAASGVVSITDQHRTTEAESRDSNSAHQSIEPNTTPSVAEETVFRDVSVSSIWDPGQFSDSDIEACFRKPAVAKARTRFAQGVLVELTRGARPVARFLDESCTVRFAVPGDLRYATADCAEAHWSTWIPLAVWAFRQLPADQTAGLLSLQLKPMPVPDTVLNSLQLLIDEICCDGISNLSPSWGQRLLRVEDRLRMDGLVWPAELAADLYQQLELYQQHDARFDPDYSVHLLGELIARMRAIARATDAVPQLLIRGSLSDRITEIDGGRFLGVGFGVHFGRIHLTAAAYLHESNTGTVVAVERTFADPTADTAESPKSIDDLATTPLVRGVSIGGLGLSQLLTRSGKRTPGNRLILPRTASSLTINPQTFQFEQLKPPFAVESFSQLQARLKYLPPSWLRPRRRTDNLYGIAVTTVDDVCFDTARQQLSATLRDCNGDNATLIHPFHDRAANGFRHLLETLEQKGDQVRFVCGHVRATTQGLAMYPVLLVTEDGSRRTGFSPWIEQRGSTNPAGSATISDGKRDSLSGTLTLSSPVDEFMTELHQTLADLLLIGLSQYPADRCQFLRDKTRRCQQLGFTQIAATLSEFADIMASRNDSLRWNGKSAVPNFKMLCMISRLAGE